MLASAGSYSVITRLARLFCRMRQNPNPCSICAFRRQLAAFIPRVTVVTRGTCWEETGGEQRNRPNYRVPLGRAAPWRPKVDFSPSSPPSN